MDVYFTTLGGNNRRHYGKLRQIPPTPTVVNNVVLYDALFEVENPDQVLMTQMTAQVFFVAASAKDAVLVPIAALQPASSYELGSPAQLPYAPIYPAYLRGLAQSKAGQAQQAAAEFQKLRPARSFHHDPQERFRPGITDEDAAVIPHLDAQRPPEGSGDNHTTILGHTNSGFIRHGTLQS